MNTLFNTISKYENHSYMNNLIKILFLNKSLLRKILLVKRFTNEGNTPVILFIHQ